jgi:hypothetical protein
LKTCDTTYEALIGDVLRQQLGSSIVGLTPIPTYPDTIVYEAQTPEQRVIFKAMEPNGRDPDGIGLEAWACEAAAAQGVPAPRVLVVDTSCRSFPSSFFVMVKAAGRSLAELQFEREGVESLLREVGQALRRLHDVRLPGFG